MGDVTVNVNGGADKSTARTIVDQLRREMRRGTSKKLEGNESIPLPARRMASGGLSFCA